MDNFHSDQQPSPPLTERLRNLLQAGATQLLNTPQEILEQIEQHSFAMDSRKVAAEDPVVVASTRRAIRSGIVQWAAAIIDNPGAPVIGELTADMVNNAKELARRDAMDIMFNATQSAQNSIWQIWMQIVFTLSEDPKELRDLISLSSRSIAAFTEHGMRQITEIMQAEREQQLRGTHLDRRQVVTALLEGENIPVHQVQQRLSYSLEQQHHAAIIWSEEAEPVLAKLEQAAKALGKAAQSERLLNVMVNAATFWVWVNGDQKINRQTLHAALRKLPGIRIAIGSSGFGLEGFRSAHLDAINTQRVPGRLHSSAQVISFDEVRLISLMTQDLEGSKQFVKQTLGELARANRDLRTSLYTYLACGCNAAAAAEVLHTHRNTLLRRLQRAEDLLPQPLHENRIHIAAALELLNWTQGDR